MPRKTLFRSNFLPYHVTARANNRERFPIKLERMWETITNSAYLSGVIHSAEIHSLVLMPNHFHMLLTVPEADLGKVMNHFMVSVTKSVNLESSRSGRIFGGPYHWSLIGSGLYFAHAYKYVYRNPVKAGISDTVEGYPWSTLHGLLGFAHLPIPLHIPRSGHGQTFLNWDISKQLDWLNRPFPREADQAISKGLFKKSFSEIKDRNTRKPLAALNAII